MSVTFVHSADWQLGARFAQFSEKASRLREIRVETLARTLSMAVERGADAFLVAGDLFEDNHVDEALVAQVVSLFESVSPLPILLLPGNHDPYTGPDSVWDRNPFLQASSHIHIFREPGKLTVKGAQFLGAPLQQKVSTLDPSLALHSLSKAFPEDTLKIGVTHGAIAIPGKHQPNDFPIALDAATRAGLDYLGVGHWHQWQVYDEGRLVMPGTPESDDFGQERAGQVALVRLEEHGRPPQVDPVSVGRLNWRRLEFRLGDEIESRRSIEALLEDASTEAGNLIARVVLQGATTAAQLVANRQWLDDRLDGVFAFQLRDESYSQLSETEMSLLAQDHPLVDQVLRDLECIKQLISPGETSVEQQTVTRGSGLSLASIQALLDEGRIPLASLKVGHLEQAKERVMSLLREEVR